MNMENYIAKPDKTLLEHTKDVKEQLEVMRRIGYIPNQKIFCLLTILVNIMIKERQIESSKKESCAVTNLMLIGR